MDAALFSAHDVNTPRAAVEGEKVLPDGSTLIWGLSRREFGAMTFYGRPEWDITHNRMQFLRIWNLKIDDVVAPCLDHTANVAVVTAKDKRKGARELSSALPRTDGLLTRDPNLVLMTTHADCLPVWLVAPESGWIGMLHAGWRGIAAGILRTAVGKIPETDRAGLTLAIGPGICAKHYQVSQEVAEVFLKDPVMASAVQEKNGKTHLDLLEAASLQGEAAGAAVDTSMFICTYESEYLASWRRDGESFTPMAAFITRMG
ncbi:MAG: laccase domain-containing protein [bacterium]